MIKTKRGEGLLSPRLVALIILAATLVVFLVITPAFTEVIKKVSEKGACEWEFLFTAVTKTPGIKNVNRDPNCPHHEITITMEDLEGNKKKAINYIKKFNEEHPDQKFINFDVTDEDSLLEYSMNEIHQKELRYCADVVWKGHFSFFDEWWNLYDWTFFGLKEPIKDEEEALNIFIGKFNKAPVNCVICARIKYDEKIKKKFTNEITSLPEQMKKTPVTGDPLKRSYFEYTILDEKNKGLYKPTYRYSTQEAYDVVYTRVNPHVLKQWGQTLLRWVGAINEIDQAKPLQTLALIPYKDRFNECTYAIE